MFVEGIKDKLSDKRRSQLGFVVHAETIKALLGIGNGRLGSFPLADEHGSGNGLKLVGRWHGLDGRTGVAIFECDDPQTIALWSMAWATTMDITVTPVVGDDAIKTIGAALRS